MTTNRLPAEEGSELDRRDEERRTRAAAEYARHRLFTAKATAPRPGPPNF